MPCMQLLLKRGLPHLTVEKCRKVFTFPVKNYYQKIGFDFSQEPFEIPVMEFINQYYPLFNKTRLFDTAKSTPEKLQQQDIRQYILSTMQENK